MILRRKKLFLAVTLVLVVVIGLLTSGLTIANFGGTPAEPIANGLIYSNILQKSQMIAMRPPIAHVAIPQHPYMASNGGSNMHGSAYMSDAYEARGPVGINPIVSSSFQGQPGLVPSINFDSKGRIVGVSVRSLMVGGVNTLLLMNPNSLKTLSSYDLPPRQAYSQFNLGGGIYFFIDNKDRAVVSTFAHTVQVIKIPRNATLDEFRLVREYDISQYVVPMPAPLTDDIVCILPSWDGQYYWFGTEQGVIGTINVASGEVHSIWLQGEHITNTFAIGEDGAYILTDYALYRFNHDASGNIVQDWCTTYQRATQMKPFALSLGSGTSPTLMGGLDGLVVITDNAEPKINVLFINRSDGAVVTSTPVFQDNQSSTEASLIGFEQADASGIGTGVYSVVVVNNWGVYNFPDWNAQPGGITRIDATKQSDGTYTSPEYYLSTLDFQTGQTVYRVLTGTGTLQSVYGTPAYLHPSGGIAYGYTFSGLVMIRDYVQGGSLTLLDSSE
jgi:hypothetical protein